MMEYSQGPLQGGNVGDRIRSVLGRGDGDGPDLSQGMMDNLDIPNNPGPAVAGRTPLVGSLRRSRDMPVIRDQLQGQLGS